MGGRAMDADPIAAVQLDQILDMAAEVHLIAESSLKAVDGSIGWAIGRLGGQGDRFGANADDDILDVGGEIGGGGLDFEAVAGVDLELLVWLCAAGFDATREQVGVPDKVGDEGGLGPIVDVCGGADLFEAALVHDCDPIGEGEGFVLVMGDHDEGHAEFPVEGGEFELHFLAQLEVEGSKGFVEEHDGGAIDEGTG